MLMVKNKNISLSWEFYFHGNSFRKNSIVLTLNVTALSCRCKKQLKELII